LIGTTIHNIMTGWLSLSVGFLCRRFVFNGSKKVANLMDNRDKNVHKFYLLLSVGFLSFFLIGLMYISWPVSAQNSPIK
jgi:hypothetical protein